MPGTSAAHTVWFIAAVMVAAMLAGAVVGITFSISQGLSDKGTQLEGQLNTKIKIINDPKRVPYDVTNKTATFYVHNAGYSILNHNRSSILVLINGTTSGPPDEVSIYGGGTSWRSGEVAIINVTAPGLVTDVDYSVWITVSDTRTGATASDSMDFNIIFA
jgi:archaellum component FlaG (FlaF/FlaG flagellin family)